MRLKKINYILAFLATIMFSGVFAQQTAKITPSGIGYLQYLPQGYSSNTNKYPIVISLHGIKEKGTTSTDPATVLAGVSTVANVGLPKYVKYGQQYPFILISPQLKSNYGTWPADYIIQVLNYVKTYLRVDDRRIYLTGLSLGGYGVWTTAGAYPQVFAAIAPVCSGGNAISKACAIASENIAVWAFHGDADVTVNYSVSLNMVNAINNCATKPNPLAKITIYPGMTHVIWDKAYKESGVLDWMLTFTNGTSPSPTPTTNVAPVANAGADVTITLPTNSVSIQGSGSDSDGTIASYVWTKISGGAATLTNATTSKLTASGLTAGAYVFRLTVKDNMGASKYDDVAVNVNSTTTTTNAAPIVSAGVDKMLALPTNWTSLQGSASDPDGSIASYQWTKVAGGNASMTYATTARLNISQLVAGTYTFRLTVKDNKGASKSDDVIVQVSGSTTSTATASATSTSTTTTTTNVNPVVSAGSDKTLTLPTNWTSLQGSASDADGSIASYQWTKLSGGNASLTYATTARLNISQLVEGTYLFRLTVKDNKGAIKYDDVYVYVKSSTTTTK